MKKLANLKGAKLLNRLEQKEIFGGDPVPHGDGNGGAGGGGGTCTVKCNNGYLLDVMDCGAWADAACAWHGWTVCVC